MIIPVFFPNVSALSQKLMAEIKEMIDEMIAQLKGVVKYTTTPTTGNKKKKEKKEMKKDKTNPACLC